MWHFIAVPLVTLCPALHGSEQDQGQYWHTTRLWFLGVLHAVSLGDMSALLGMELETTAPTLVQLMYIVSACRIPYFTSVRFM